jgi:predicted metal-dependent hydrolase
VNSRRSWIAEHRGAETLLGEGSLIGKAHRLHFETKSGVETPKTRVTPTEIRITHKPSQLSSSKPVQTAVKKAGLRALKQEAEHVMPVRLRDLALQLGFTYKSLDFKQLKARWGSCSHQKDITLNIFLMVLPWRLIEYVMVHELVHTVVLHHGSDFWREFERVMPDAKKRRKELKGYSPYF